MSLYKRLMKVTGFTSLLRRSIRAPRPDKPSGIAVYGRGSTYGDTVTLTSGEPEITSHPLDVVVDETRTAVFTVEHLNGTSYEWYKVETGEVVASGDVEGSTITLSLGGVSQSNEGYYCKVMNDKGEVDSRQARLTVTPLTCGDWRCWVSRRIVRVL